MIITCQACDTRFRLDDKLVRPTGSRARCSVCATIFTVYPESQPPALVPEAPAQPDFSRLADDASAQKTELAPDTDNRGHDRGDEGQDDGETATVSGPDAADTSETDALGVDAATDEEDERSADLDSFFADKAETAPPPVETELPSVADAGPDAVFFEEIETVDEDLDLFFGDEEETEHASVAADSPPMTGAEHAELSAETVPVKDEASSAPDLLFPEAKTDPGNKPDDDRAAAKIALEEAETVVGDLDDDALMMEITGILDEGQGADGTALVEEEDDGALGLSDADLNFSLDLTSVEEPETAETDSQNDDPDMGVEDLDLALEMDDGFDGQRPEDVDLDLDADLNFILEMEPREDKGPEPVSSDAQVDDHQAVAADLTPSTSDLSDGLADGLADGLTDDLDLSGLDDLLSDSLDVAESAGTDGEEPELSLEIGADDHQAVAADLIPSTSDLSDGLADGLTDDLDLSGLDDLLSDSLDAAESAGTDGEEPELSLEIGADDHQAVDLTPSTSESDLSDGLADDLDLSGLDDLLNDSLDVAESAGTGGEEPELSLDLDLETSLSIEKESDDDGAEMTLDELQLELEEKGILSGQSSTDASELDLAEIEQILETSGTGADVDSFSPSLDQELDLDIEASLGAEKWMTEASGMETVVMDEEIDLAEFEEVIDAVDTNAVVDDSGEEPELELDLDGDQISSETVAVNHDSDFELSDFDGGTGGGASLQEISRSLDSRDSLDLDIEDDDDLEETIAVHSPEPVAVAADPPPLSPPSLSPPAAPSQPAAMASASRGPRTAGARKKSSAGKRVAMVLLILLIILGGIAGAGYYFVVQKGMEIPYIGQYLSFLNPDPDGIKKLSTGKITGQYVENTSAGRLFVVSGTVKNGYSTNRGMILLKGKLFSKGKEIRQQAVYAGNMMSDLELANLEQNKITERMGNRLGDNQRNMKIAPGQTIPFMIVFFGFQGEPDEFAVEMTASKPAR